MKSARGITIGAAVFIGLAFAAASAIAHPDGNMHQMHGHMHGQAHGMHGMSGMSGMSRGDPSAGADMNLVHQMVVNHEQIQRSVTNLPDGIKTVTESADPQVAQAIKAHVASMVQRLADGREFNLFSSTIPVLFENRNKIRTTVVESATGTVVTQTSEDPKVVMALQAHAIEVSDLAREGMTAMRRNARANMAGMMRRGSGTGAAK